MKLELPGRTTVVEVGMRDGLQSFPRWIPTDVKAAMIARMVDAGFRVIEATAFGRPDVIPNLRDAEEVMARVPRAPDVVYRALVPNARGAERALAAGVDAMSGLVTVSETYTRKNQNMSVDDACEQARLAFEVAAGAAISFDVYVGMAFFCPYEGAIPWERTLDVVERLYGAGIRGFILAGSLGMEDPRHVNDVVASILERWDDARVGFHIHNLAGFGAANALAALAGGATTLEGSVGGIGGGMVVPSELGSVGNMPTEDLVHLLNEMGVETGLDTAAVRDLARWVGELLEIEPGGFVTRSGTRSDVLAEGGSRAEG